MITYYFAYGSNMDSKRINSRIDSAEVVGIALIRDYQLEMNKRGLDGSAKANIVPREDKLVWGVIYKIAYEDWGILDTFERGYDRLTIQVELNHGTYIEAMVYVSTRSEDLTDDLLPFSWYRAMLIRGSEENHLPFEYREHIASFPVCSDNTKQC